MRGERVRVLVAETNQAGEYTATWDGRDENGNLMPSGNYFDKLTAGNFVSIGKIILVR